MARDLTPPPKPRQEWEYLITVLGGSLRSVQNQMTAFGSDGWELVTVFINDADGAHVLYMKRQAEDERENHEPS